MSRAWGPALAVIMFAVLLVAATHLITAAAQAPVELEPPLERAFVMVRQAEAAGATQNELAILVLMLNHALQLQNAISTTPPNETDRRTELSAQLDQLLTSLGTRAGQLQVTASQRTRMNTILAYVSGGIVAVLATFAYAYGLSFWRRYRVKRMFQMRISPK